MLIKIENLEQLRKVKDISYEELEKTISRGTYRDIVTGRRTASKASIQKMTQIFHVEVKDIEGLLKN